MTQRRQIGRALFYTRDSGGKHELTPTQYVSWASRKANELGVSFDGTADAIEDMIHTGSSRRGSLFLDYGVPGNLLSREGLNALLKEAMTDPEVTHVFIPRRDRLYRPDDPADGLRLEDMLRHSGVTLVFMDRICAPLVKGRRRDIAEMITTLIDYEKSGKDRRELGEKMIFAQIRLARMGFSVGGRPPYGFRRWLAKEDGTRVRQLADRERVRMPGHHVVWYPSAKDELAVIQRILDMLATMPASRVAAILTAEGVPTPDWGRERTDHGIRHKTSGVWHQSVITGIARNPLIACIAAYGRRSMGDQVRFSPDGPRNLEENDLRADGKPKVVRNSDSSLIKSPVAVRFDPVIDPEKQAKVIALLDQRGQTQRGKPRSRNPAQNPLGCRVFDINCTWPMYRQPYADTFRYTCGLYQQSHGADCAHNHIDGPTAVRFLLGCLRQRILTPQLFAKLKRRLLELARQELKSDKPVQQIEAKQEALAQVGAKLDLAGRNLALAETPQQFKMVARAIDDLALQRDRLESELAEQRRTINVATDIDADLAAAMELVHDLTKLAADPENYKALGEVFNQVNVRMFLRFSQVQIKKRIVNKVVGGVVTFGSAPPPIVIYSGPTGRREIKGPTSSADVGPSSSRTALPPESSHPGREDSSLGNVRRGDWIRTSDLLNPIQCA
jgi:DNA invertase Pin-like site-specific DNA recombinase